MKTNIYMRIARLVLFVALWMALYAHGERSIATGLSIGLILVTVLDMAQDFIGST